MASLTATAVPVVQLHVVVAAAPQRLVWPLQQLLAVLQEADTPSPRVAWARGLHSTTSVPAVIQKEKHSNKKIENDKKKRTEKQQISVFVNAFAVGAKSEVRSHSTLLLIVYRDFQGSGARKQHSAR